MNDEEREYLNEMIRNLNNQLVDALRERDEAAAEINRLQAVLESCNTMEQVILGMARGERDELRREICERESERGVKTPQEAAEERQWDCFKNGA